MALRPLRRLRFGCSAGSAGLHPWPSQNVGSLFTPFFCVRVVLPGLGPGQTFNFAVSSKQTHACGGLALWMSARVPKVVAATLFKLVRKYETHARHQCLPWAADLCGASRGLGRSYCVVCVRSCRHFADRIPSARRYLETPCVSVNCGLRHSVHRTVRVAPFVQSMLVAMLMNIVVVAAGSVATTPQRAVERDTWDAVVLLQAEYTMKASGKMKAAGGTVPAIDRSGFEEEGMRAAGVCRGLDVRGGRAGDGAGSASHAEGAGLVLIAPMLSEADGVLATRPEERPCGSKVFAAMLELMTVFVVLHGVRRWIATSAKSAAMEGSTSKMMQKSGASGTAIGDPLQLAMRAAHGGDGDECLRLLSVVSQGVDLDCQDDCGCTPLHFASKGGSVAVVRRLLELGAFVDSRDAWDETPLHLAASLGHTECCEAPVGSPCSTSEVGMVSGAKFS